MKSNKTAVQLIIRPTEKGQSERMYQTDMELSLHLSGIEGLRNAVNGCITGNVESSVFGMCPIYIFIFHLRKLSNIKPISRVYVMHQKY